MWRRRRCGHTIRLDSGAVKRTVPVKPEGGLKALGDIDRWEHAAFLKAEMVRQVCGEEEGRSMLEYRRSMRSFGRCSHLARSALESSD